MGENQDTCIKKHYLETELYNRFQEDSTLFDFLQLGSLDGIWYWDLENPEIEWISPHFWELLGYDPAKKKHLSSEWQDLINQDDLKLSLWNFLKHCDDPSHLYDQVVRYLHKDGSTIWLRCRGIAIRDQTGKPLRMLGAHTDLTELKRTEEKLIQKTKELESANRKLKRTLSGLLPICASCKKIRNDAGYWDRIESYLCNHAEVQFTHSLCPQCSIETRASLGLDPIPENNP